MFKMRNVIVSGILMLLILSGCSSETSLTTDEKVTGLVTSYLEALETKDISAMVKYTDDLRFPDKEEQKKQYSNIEEEITDTKIVEIKKVSETKFKATVEIVSDGNLNELTFPIQKQEKD
jgi:ketosteroid isomerase-like protein